MFKAVKTMLSGFLIILIALLGCVALSSAGIGIGYLIEWITGINKDLVILVECGIFAVCIFGYLIGIFAE